MNLKNSFIKRNMAAEKYIHAYIHTKKPLFTSA